MSPTFGAIRPLWWANQLPASTDLHPGDSLLPPADESLKRKLNALPSGPGGVKLFAGLIVDPDVVNIDNSSRCGFDAVSLNEVPNPQHGGSWFHGRFDFRLYSIGHLCSLLR